MEVRWCTTSDPEQQKCSNMSKSFQEAGIQPSLLCVQGTSADHCVQLITVSPLPSSLPPQPARQEGSDSGGSTQQLHSLGKSPMPTLLLPPPLPHQDWAIGSPEFPRQQGPACFLPRPGFRVLGGLGKGPCSDGRQLGKVSERQRFSSTRPRPAWGYYPSRQGEPR